LKLTISSCPNYPVVPIRDPYIVDYDEIRAAKEGAGPGFGVFRHGLGEGLDSSSKSCIIPQHPKERPYLHHLFIVPREIPVSPNALEEA
jgi:hypothetical protein